MIVVDLGALIRQGYPARLAHSADPLHERRTFQGR